MAMTEREKLKRKILSPAPVNNLDEITEKIPFALSYSGPGRWINLLKEINSISKSFLQK